ncbi:hypothetical protein C8E87_2158 [Paractinoplanes brasiliensis]|uniref:Uncharacterized protein n=1 Tax=Paractinoplanes brasiliensis TaxID=52695 RepID=A0A4R6JS06_9ACTN|nr:hypothetical protein C8E87_2158 [Actinoplanes brasiliensis]GID26724.1 hypothetical protein Abr02nite_17070 [Actinoplanes brasiliensis]
MVATGWEAVHPDLRRMRATKAPIYVGGFESGEMWWCLGAFVGRPLRADRVEMNPEWFIPEEVCPSPRDERFADVIEGEGAWDPRRWWWAVSAFSRSVFCGLQDRVGWIRSSELGGSGG